MNQRIENCINFLLRKKFVIIGTLVLIFIALITLDVKIKEINKTCKKNLLTDELLQEIINDGNNYDFLDYYQAVYLDRGRLYAKYQKSLNKTECLELDNGFGYLITILFGIGKATFEIIKIPIHILDLFSIGLASVIFDLVTTLIFAILRFILLNVFRIINKIVLSSTKNDNFVGLVTTSIIRFMR